MIYKIEIKDIRTMIKLMKKLEAKTFNVDDNKELTSLSSRFLFASKAVDYTDGYSLVPLNNK